MTSTDDGGTDSRTAGPPASWADRAGALGIDVLFGLAALGCLLLIGWSAIEALAACERWMEHEPRFQR